MEFTKEQKDSQISQIEKQWKTYRVEKEICAGGPATVYQLRRRDGKKQWDRALLSIYSHADPEFAAQVEKEIDEPDTLFGGLGNLNIYDYAQVQPSDEEKLFLIMLELDEECLTKWVKEQEELEMQKCKSIEAEVSKRETDLKKLQQLKQFRSLCPISEGDFAGYSEWVKKHQSMMTLLQSETTTAILDGMVRFAELYGEGDAVDVFKKVAERVRSEIENKDKQEEVNKLKQEKQGNSEKVIQEKSEQKGRGVFDSITQDRRETLLVLSRREKKKENIQPGAIIEFGHYPQTAGGKDSTPIKWRVLKSEGNRALVISEMGIDCKEYHGKFKDVTWADCDLRKWLNSEFKAKAFSNEEIRKVQMFTNENKDNSEYGTKGGKATEDQIFLLSLEEAEKYFKDDGSRRCKATEYAVKQGAYVDDGKSLGAKANGFSWWWLRSPGYNCDFAAGVNTDGSLLALGYGVILGNVMVRPALWLTI